MENKNIIIGIIVIALIIFAINSAPKRDFFPKGLFPLFSIADDYKSQLKSEYTTYWGGAEDGTIDYAQRYNGENDKFKWNNIVAGDVISEYTDNADSFLDVKHNFYGQEVSMILIGEGAYFNSISIEGVLGREKEGVIYLKPHTLNNNLVDVIANGMIKSTITVSNPFYLRFTAHGFGCGCQYCDCTLGRIHIPYIGYKAQYSCDLSPNEVWMHEDFAQPFSIKDLAYISTKFCRETRPFTLRDIQQGDVPIYPDPIPDFNRGQVLTPPSNNLIGVNYATYFVNGVNNKCAPNEANFKVAGKWICSQVIKPIEIIAQCQSNNDCPIPLKNQCPNYFVGCQNQKCVYDDNALNSSQCKNEVITIIKQVQLQDYRAFVNVTSDNTFSFTEGVNTHSFNIGNAKFTSYTTSSCQMSGDVDYFTPAPSCFKAAINYDGNNYNVKDSQVLTLTPYIKFVYYGGGTIKRTDTGTDSQLTGTYYFTISRDALSINIGGTSEILKDSIKSIEANIMSNLPDAKVILKVTQRVKNTNQNLPEKTYDFDIKQGDNKISFNIDTSNLGINQFNVQVFYKVQSALIPSNQYLFNYNVVTSLSGIKEPVIVYTNTTVAKKEVEGEVVTGDSLLTAVKVIGVIIGILILWRL